MDQEIDRFFGKMASIRMDIQDYENWCEKYESFRREYPQWITRTNEAISIYDMEDDHLNNTIKMLEKKDKENSWLEVLKQEKTYRELKSKIKDLKKELSSYEDTADKVF